MELNTVTESYPSGNIYTYTSSLGTDMTSDPINIDENNTDPTLDVVNTPEEGSIEVTKTGLLGNDQANLSLYDSSNNLVQTSPQTVSNGGIASWTNLPFGDYYIVEDFNGITNTYSYTVSNPVANITVDGDETDTIVNTPEKGSITVTKTGLLGNDQANLSLYDSSDTLVQTSPQTVSNANPVASWTDLSYGDYYIIEDFNGVINTYNYTISNPTNITVDGDETDTIVNTPYGNIVVEKTGLLGSDQANLSLYDSSDTLVQTSPQTVSNTNPLAIWNGLPFGDYYVVEDFNGITNTYSYTVSNPVANITVDGSETEIIENTPEKGSITVCKSGLIGDDYAIFTLTGPEGNPGFWTSLTLTDGGCETWYDLPYGTYTVTESYPFGNTYNYTSSLGTDMTSDPIIINANNENPEIEVVNTPKYGEITVCKFDAGTEEPLLGSTFQLQYYRCLLSLTDKVSEIILQNNGCQWIVMDEVTLDEENCYTWYGLDYGQWRVVEVAAPAGYALEDPVEVTIDKENLTHQVDVYDPRIPSRGSITLNKSGLDSTDTAGFTLYDSSNNAVGAEKTVTGNGTVQWTSLPKDTYSIVETTVPSGYSKMADITGIVIESGNLNYTFDRVNTETPPGELEVLGIQELPFTGMNPVIPISGITMILGGAAMFIASIRKKFRRK